MASSLTSFTIEQPAWLGEAAPIGERYAAAEDRVGLAIALAGRNVEAGTGGPFGAAVFERATGRLVAAGVNVVVPSGLSIAHAEVVALSLAQSAVGSFDLRRGPSSEGYELATSAEPCVMCLGAIHWSGIRSVVAAARDADVRAIGFDEGPKPGDWSATLQAAGIDSAAGIRRAEAVAVLERYRDRSGQIYNAGG